MKNIITAIIFALAMLISLSSCLSPINRAGEDGTDDIITDNTTEETDESETHKKVETTEMTVSGDKTQEETDEITESTETEVGEPKEDYVVLMPEEFPEEMQKAIAENDLLGAVWVANVNGRYLGVMLGQAFQQEIMIIHDYYFVFPEAASIWIFDSNTDSLIRLTGRQDEINSLISEEEVRILYDNIPEDMHIYRCRLENR